jgi:hypothetical protein
MTICIWLKRLALCSKEDVAMQVINYYKFIQSTKTVELLKKVKVHNNVWMIFLELEKMESFLEMIC